MPMAHEKKTVQIWKHLLPPRNTVTFGVRSLLGLVLHNHPTLYLALNESHHRYHSPHQIKLATSLVLWGNSVLSQCIGVYSIESNEGWTVRLHMCMVPSILHVNLTKTNLNYLLPQTILCGGLWSQLVVMTSVTHSPKACYTEDLGMLK